MSAVINPTTQDFAGVSAFSNPVIKGAVIGSIVGEAIETSDRVVDFLKDFFVMSSGFGIGYGIGTAIDRAFGISDAVADWLGKIENNARQLNVETGWIFTVLPTVYASATCENAVRDRVQIDELDEPSWKANDIFPSVTEAGTEWLIDHDYEACRLDNVDCVLGTIAAPATVPLDIADDILWSIISVF